MGKISSLLSGKMDMVFQMKEEVEGEYAERMEDLREIYRKEIAQQAEHQAKDSDKWRELESVLNQKIGDKKAELDDTISYYSQREAEYETKIDELMTRLQEQTTMYMKLQAEFESYEWYEDGEVPETTTGAVEGEGDEHPPAQNNVRLMLTTDADQPKRLQGKRTKQVGRGDHHSPLLMNIGKVFSHLFAPFNPEQIVDAASDPVPV